MYNDASDDQEAEYKFFLTLARNSIIRMYSLDGNGRPNFISNYTIPSGGKINNIAVHPTSKYIYLSDTDNNIVYVYQVNNDGSIIEIDNKSTGASTAPYDVEVDPMGKYVFVTCSDTTNGNIVLIYSISSDGKLTGPGSANTPVGSGPRLMAFHPSGQYLYVALNDGNTGNGGGFSSFQLTSNGNLSSLGYTSVGIDIYDITVHPNGNYLYLTSVNSTPYVYKYNINTNGTIDTISKTTYTIGFENPFGFTSLAIHPDGKYIYMKDGFSSRIFAYQINADGTLTYVDSAHYIASGICNLIIHPNRRNMYMTERSGNDRFGYNIVLNNNGLFDTNYAYQETGSTATSNPIIIRKKIK